MCHGVGAAVCQDAVLQMLRAGKSSEIRVKKVVLFAPPTASTHLKALETPSLFGHAVKKDAASLSYLANLQKEWFTRVTDGGDANVPAAFRKAIEVTAILGYQDTIVTKGISGGTLAVTYAMGASLFAYYEPRPDDRSTLDGELARAIHAVRTWPGTDLYPRFGAVR
jgi:hypothetical protein